jgi:RNA polymerase sigma factor (sigma-70 family)
MNHHIVPPLHADYIFSYEALLADAQAYFRRGGERHCRDSALTAAWNQFFQIEDARLRHLVAALGLPRDWQEDVVQESWVEILKGLQGFQGAGAAARLHSWMSQVAHSRAVDLMRRLARRRVESLNALSPQRIGLTDGQSADAEEWRELLETKLAEVPTTCRLMLGHFLEGRPVKDLAAEVGLTPAAASCRIRRGIKMLRRLLTDEREIAPKPLPGAGTKIAKFPG